MPDEQEQLHAIVRGHVQGVNFRHFTHRTARKLRLTGWVRNLPDGSVEVLAEGRRGELEQLLVFLRRGSPASYVEHVAAEWRAASGIYSAFEIRYSLG